MKRACVLGVGGALLLLLWAAAARVGPTHEGTGVLLRTASSGLTVLDHGRHMTLLVGDATTILDAGGRLLRPGDLRPGDSVREGCIPLGMGRFLARRITVLGRAGDDPPRLGASPMTQGWTAM